MKDYITSATTITPPHHLAPWIALCGAFLLALAKKLVYIASTRVQQNPTFTSCEVLSESRHFYLKWRDFLT